MTAKPPLPSLAFAGTPVFAQMIAQQLHQAGFDIKLVLTNPDRPAKRGMKPQSSPVKQWAKSLNMPIYQPQSLRLDKDQTAATVAHALTQVDVLVVAAYGMLLPPYIVDGHCCLNIHASLLPRWRGAAPIQRTILAGDLETGVNIMRMDQGLDTGDVLHGAVTTMLDKSTETLNTELAILGAQCLIDVLRDLPRYQAQAKKQTQDAQSILYAHKISKQDGLIDFTDAEYICRQIRALSPQPGAHFTQNDTVYKIGQAHFTNASTVDHQPSISPGTILALSDKAIQVACQKGVLHIERIQAAGKNMLDAKVFLHGSHWQVGDVLGL